MIIRSWSETFEEAEGMCIIENLIAHNYISNPKQLMAKWKLADPEYFHDKLIAEIDGQMVGWVNIGQGKKENTHIFFFDLFVNPMEQYQGVGTKLYNKFISKVKSLGCTKIVSEIYEHPNWSSGKSFFKKHKFKHICTYREYSLNLQNINFNEYDSLLHEVLNQGFRFIEPIKEGYNLSEHYKKLESMQWSYFQDMPCPEGIKPTRDNYNLWLKEHEYFEKENYGIELLLLNSNNDYVACTQLEADRIEIKKCWTNNLGVIKYYRRKKLGTALKIEALKRLKKRGFNEIRTDNEENNPMYKINLNLGFEEVPFSLEYMKEL